MITGDNEHAAMKVANHLGIKPYNVTYSAYPETKKQVVETLQEAGEQVMFVGDGINDSPVLAQSDVGCAINSAAHITVEAAGIVLMRDNLIDVLKAILIANKSFQRIRINFLFAFLYNVVLIPVAMGVFYPINHFKLQPMFAAIAMALSSISVVSSSLMLKLYNPNVKYETKFDKVEKIKPGVYTVEQLTKTDSELQEQESNNLVNIAKLAESGRNL